MFASVLRSHRIAVLNLTGRDSASGWRSRPVVRKNASRYSSHTAYRWLWPVTGCLLLISACSPGPDPVSPDATTRPENNLTEPLASWNSSAARDAIVKFVERITSADSAEYVAESERIAVFDNDGTLWSEQPAYFQLLFAMDRIRAIAPDHPEWKNQQPFQGVLEGDLEAVIETGKAGLFELLMASHAGMTTAEFEKIVNEWVATARHPQLDRPYTELVYQPMLEVLDYLRANGFKTYIISGGGIEFMRPWAERVYGIPPEQVFGSSIKVAFEFHGGEPVLVRLPEINFIDDKEGKPVGIHRFIGRRPIAAFGNSDCDLQMLQWATAGPEASLAMLVRHTDAEREWAYDRDSHIGRLDAALDEAEEKNWLVVDMKRDWKTVYPARK
jgi:phosphoglycolate phosphatase-like HAD superfamily hydrolase